jgi:hypothetical protein
MNKVYVLLIVLCSINLIYGQTFTEIDAGLTGVRASSVAWGDFDNDGDLDILLTGNSDTGRISKIYHNDNGIFTDINSGLTEVEYSSVVWGDYDNDGDLDILLTGNSDSGRISKIYRNDNDIFTDINAGLPGVISSSVAWGDYDNDGDLDILLTGNSDSDRISKIYRNDNGMFTDINAGLIGISSSCVAWGDYDSDGDLDILLTGWDVSYNSISKIFRNNGNDTFIDINAGLTGVEYSSIAWGDYDNDGDLDILLTGRDSSNNHISKIYRNDNDTFTDINAGLTGVHFSSVAWGDYDNDGDLDILMTGWDASDNPIYRIYRNNGNGAFTDISAGLTGVYRSSVAWGDYDNDDDLDILLSGEDALGNSISKIYRNNSSVLNTAPQAPAGLNVTVIESSVQLNWDKATDNETPQDALSYNFYLGTESLKGDLNTSMSDNSTGYRNVVKLGNAQQNTSYTLNKALPTGVYYWSVQAIDHVFAGSEFAPEMCFAFSNPLSPVAVTASDITKTSFKANWEAVDGAAGYFIDVAKDEGFTNYLTAYNNFDVGDTLTCEVINLSTFTDYFYRVKAYKINNSTSLNSNVIEVKTLWDQFTEIDEGLQGVSYSSIEWGDYDNDMDLDLLITGSNGTNNISTIYRNDSGLFNDINAGLTGVAFGSAVWGDYDSDGDLDILLTGYNYTSPSYYSKIYRNDAGTFIDTNMELIGVGLSSVAWGDYDNDGDLDILFAGYNDELSYPIIEEISGIYRNDAGIFSYVDAGLTGVCNGSVAWVDYDNDEDLDIFITGRVERSGQKVSIIYNNENGMFSKVSTNIPGIEYGEAKWGDYDNDGDLDIFIAGGGSSEILTKIFRNEGNNLFNEISFYTSNFYHCSLDCGDFDNDGDLDIVICGDRVTGLASLILRNYGNGVFGFYTSLTRMADGSSKWADYDNDGDLDVIISGQDSARNRFTKLYRNNSLVSNYSPSSPSNLTSSFNDSTITFSWDKATDNETSQDGLSYNFYLGTESLQGDLNTSMSDNSSGYRKVVQLGNAQQNTSYTLNKALPNGKYYWSVQAIDHAFAGSDFAPEKSFVILSSPQNVHIKHKDDLLKLTWDEVPGAQMYYVYASDDPESEFVNVSKQGTFNGVSWTQTISSVKKFYYVVAVIK